MLFCEFTARMLWFLPFAWMIRQDMSDVHEYEADHDVLLSGINDDEYQRLLITKAAYPRLRPVVNAFTQSQVKKRFTMMCRRPSRRFVAIKSLYLLPCVAFAVTAFARPSLVEKVQREVEAEAERAPLLSPTTLIESLPLISSTESSEAVEPEKPTTINEVKVEENITNDKAVAETTTQIEEEHPSDILPKSFSSKLIGTWLKVGMQSNGRTVLQKKTIDKNGMFYVMCFHGHEGMHTIVSGRWELLDENHYIEHLDYIVTDLSSEGKDNVITYTLSEDATQLYLSYTMPGNGEQGSECWFRTE